MRRWLSRLPDGSGRLQHYQTKMTFTLKPHTIAITKLNQPSNSPNAPSHKFRVIMIVVIVVISSGSRAGVILHMKYHLRDFVNYRHPGPRRVWKGGLEPQCPPTSAVSGGICGIWGRTPGGSQSSKNFGPSKSFKL